MQVAAIYPKPNLSFPNKMNKAFPYLLRNVAITHVNQVWSTDITYIRLKNGFAYLTAAIYKFGCPTRLSMDSKGRAYDNMFVERFWRTLKQEDIYIKGYETVTECRQGRLGRTNSTKKPIFSVGKSEPLPGVSPQKVRWIQDKLNNRPRKRLGFLTPLEYIYRRFINYKSKSR